MANINLEQEFEKIEQRIFEATQKQQDLTPLLHSKVRLLALASNQLADAMRTGKAKEVVPIFAKRMGLLNNIKRIQIQINEDTAETDAEIAKVENRMRELGFGWILDNLPEKEQ